MQYSDSVIVINNCILFTESAQELTQKYALCPRLKSLTVYGLCARLTILLQLRKLYSVGR
jgi:hypothetical protein